MDNPIDAVLVCSECKMLLKLVWPKKGRGLAYLNQAKPEVWTC